MFYQMAGLSLQCSLRTILFFIVHLLSHFCTGHSQLIGSPQPIVAKVGDDIILPCHLQPAVDVAAKTFEWTRPDLNPRFVYVWRAGQDVVNVKNPSFKGRTTLFTDELKHGNISLKLSKVKPSDEGRYKCYIPDMNTDASVELVVGAVSSPVISLAGIDRDKGGVVLQCESAGWYPEPEVFWLDGEGNLLSAGPTETVRGPDDLYTVSSRVTVEKRHSNNFTCRVQQKDINQTRETHIQVPDDFFEVQSSLSPVTVGLAVCLAACIMIILLLIFSVWKWRQNRIKSKRSHRDEMDKGEQKERFKRNKPEDQLHIEAEREQLMTNETVTMKSLKNKKGERETKHFKEQQLQEEQQRRDEAEKRVQTLKDELETKRNEVESKQAELQQLQEEKQRKENDLQTVKEELENKNKERRVQNKEAELKTLKTKLETQEMELNTKIKKIEDKQAEVQQLQDEIQRKETILQTENRKLERSRVAPVQPSSPLLLHNTRLLQSNHSLVCTGSQIEDKQDEVQQLQDQIQRTETILQTEELKRSRVAPVQPSFPLFKWPIVSRQKFQDEQQRREEAESRVKTLEEELERLTAEVQKLQQQKQRSQNELQNELETRTKEVHLSLILICFHKPICLFFV
ncbi:butyrophilin-like protein 1 [Micropterus dolomieu]|uniref:butyrophilin-like protein 1 n=1 Tax=Micropterus dolomieu TaxID=147949 RepID=UPI001E8CA46C|nr:butyrophilin-like protein 1 [Micropterus dolomieu]